MNNELMIWLNDLYRRTDRIAGLYKDLPMMSRAYQIASYDLKMLKELKKELEEKVLLSEDEKEHLKLLIKWCKMKLNMSKEK